MSLRLPYRLPYRLPALLARRFACVALAWLLASCAALSPRDPVQVHVAGIEPLPGQGMEIRFAVKLRVQNPNDTPIDYDGLFIELDVRDQTFATGVSDAKGSVPRYGETVLVVPVTVSTLNALRQVIGFAGSGGLDKLDYRLRGKIGTGLMPVRFEHKGELAMPGVR